MRWRAAASPPATASSATTTSTVVVPYGAGVTEAAIHTTQVTSSSAQRLREAEARAGQPPEGERGQRDGRQADDLDQQEEPERVEHLGAAG